MCVCVCVCVCTQHHLQSVCVSSPLQGMPVYSLPFAGCVRVCVCVFYASCRIVYVFESCAAGRMCLCVCMLCPLQNGSVCLSVYPVQFAGYVCECVFCARSRIVCVFESCAI